MVLYVQAIGFAIRTLMIVSIILFGGLKMVKHSFTKLNGSIYLKTKQRLKNNNQK